MSRPLKEINKEAIQFAHENAIFIKTLVDEVFSSSVVKNIDYTKFFSNNSYTQVCNFSKAVEYVMEKVNDNGYFKDIVTQVPEKKPLWFTWSSDTQDKQIQVYKEEYDICNGAVFYIRDKENLKCIQFTTDKTVDFKTASNFYMNNQKELEKISYYLLNKIELFLYDKGNFPKARFTGDFDYSFNAQNQDHSSNLEFQSNYQNISKKYIVGGKDVVLSTRQNECLNLLAKGLSGKEIAKVLNISPRTVETHIKDIKIKMNLCFKSDLIKAYQINSDPTSFY